VTVKRNEADVACEIISEKQGPVFYRELLEEILSRMGREINPRNMAAVYTQLNLDNRMMHVGDGYWTVRVR
jgi:DNA-directed RNA polymerase subunit delta